MTDINLLPWRDQLRAERKTQFLISVGFSAFSALIVMLLIHFVFQYRIDTQHGRNNYLKSEIKVLDKRIHEISTIKRLKAELISRMNVIQDLQSNRSKMVHFFDELVMVLPKGVYLKKVTRNAGTISVVGMAESNTNISNMMRKVDASKWLFQPKLLEIKSVALNHTTLNQFNLNLSLEPEATVSVRKPK